MKDLKKLLITAISIFLVTVTFVGCNSTENVSSEKNGQKNEAKESMDFLIGGEWYYHDKNSGEDFNIAFNKNGEYFYYCDCGEPVGNSDIYDKYDYDVQNRIIKLMGPDNQKAEINVIYYDDFYLVLRLDNAIRVFKNRKNFNKDIPNETVAGMQNKPAAYLHILGSEEGKVTLAPLNYDGDSKSEFEDFVTDINLAKNAKFRSLYITYTNGKETNRNDAELQDSDKEFFGEVYHTGFVLFNDKGEVENITFYGTVENFN